MISDDSLCELIGSPRDCRLFPWHSLFLSSVILFVLSSLTSSLDVSGIVGGILRPHCRPFSRSEGIERPGPPLPARHKARLEAPSIQYRGRSRLKRQLNLSPVSLLSRIIRLMICYHHNQVRSSKRRQVSELFPAIAPNLRQQYFNGTWLSLFSPRLCSFFEDLSDKYY